MFLLFLQMFYINFHDVHIVISSTCHINLHPKTLFGCEWSRHSTIQGQKFTASDEVVKLLENKHRRAGEVGRWCVCLCVLCFCCLCFCFCLWRVFVYVCGCFLKIWDAVLTTMSDCGNLRGRDSLTKKTKKHRDGGLHVITESCNTFIKHWYAQYGYIAMIQVAPPHHWIQWSFFARNPWA